jgi:hypothetical protein
MYGREREEVSYSLHIRKNDENVKTHAKPRGRTRAVVNRKKLEFSSKVMTSSPMYGGKSFFTPKLSGKCFLDKIHVGGVLILPERSPDVVAEGAASTDGDSHCAHLVLNLGVKSVEICYKLRSACLWYMCVGFRQITHVGQGTSARLRRDFGELDLVTKSRTFKISVTHGRIHSRCSG